MNKIKQKLLTLGIFFIGFTTIFFLIKVFIISTDKSWQDSIIIAIAGGLVSTLLLSFFTYNKKAHQ
jgi:hypothetical protein